MNRLFIFTLTLALPLLFTGCGQAPPQAAPDTRAADQKAISDIEAGWNIDWKSKDLDGGR